jgi:hypothetical protein
MLSPGELETVGGGAAPARAALAGLRASGAPAKQVQQAERGLAAAQRAQTMGLTSVPGYLRSVKEHGAASTLAAGAKDQWHNTSPAWSALMVGAPLASAAGTLGSKEHRDGPGKGEELGRNLGGVVGGIAGSAMPLAGNMLVGGALAGAGAGVGRGIDWMRGRRKPLPAPASKTPDLAPAEGQHTPSERVMSPAAAGQQPEVGL